MLPVASISLSEVILLGRKRRVYFSFAGPLDAYRLARRRTMSTDDVKYCDAPRR